MSRITKNLSICILAFFILGGFTSPKATNAQESEVLKNGLTVIVKENHKNPIVVFSALVDIGSANEGKYLGSGISHLTEHMLFKSTKKYSPGEIESILHEHGGNIQAFTSFDYTGVQISILKEHTLVALDILEDMLLYPTFDKKELDKEKEVIKREMALGEDDSGKKISRLTFQNAFFKHPYRIPIIGYKEMFSSLERKDLIGFFNTYYLPQNMVISIVGDVEKEAIFAEIRKRFGKKIRANIQYAVVPSEPEQLRPRLIEEKSAFDASYLNIAFHSTSILNKDLYAMDVLSFILGHGESSRLNRSLRLDKSLVLSIASYNYTPKYPGLFVISSVLKEETARDAFSEIKKEIALLKNNGISDEELEKAKNNFLAGYMYEKEKVSAQANDLAVGNILTGDHNFFETYIENIKKVTKDDVARVAKKYLIESNMTTVALTPSGKSLDLKKEATKEKKTRSIKKITLKNDLPVLLSEDSSLPVVSIVVLMKAGIRVETDENNGISRLLSSMLLDGTETMSREEIADLYETKGMSVNVYSANNSIGIRVDALKEYTLDALELVSNMLKGSNIPEKELDKERKETLSMIEMQDDSIFNHGHRLLKETLFKKHSYRLQAIGKKESIEKIARKDLLGFLKNITLSENMVLGICGDFSASEPEPIIIKNFSDISSKKPDLISPEKESPLKKIRELAIDVDKKQSLILIGYHGIDIYDKDRYAFQVLVDMLSRESGVIFKNIREKSALSYAQGAFEARGIDPGYLAIYVLTSRENIKKVKGMLFKEIDSFKNKGISQEELDRSKNHLKSARVMEMETNSQFIFLTSLDELYGLGYNDFLDYNKKIDSVTKEDIEAVALRFLNNDKASIVILKGKD
ncbi:MAG: pitrilysin family protein [Candidatus Omnitrophota bacterium]